MLLHFGSMICRREFLRIYSTIAIKGDTSYGHFCNPAVGRSLLRRVPRKGLNTIVTQVRHARDATATPSTLALCLVAIVVGVNLGAVVGVLLAFAVLLVEEVLAVTERLVVVELAVLSALLPLPLRVHSSINHIRDGLGDRLLHGDIDVLRLHLRAGSRDKQDGDQCENDSTQHLGCGCPVWFCVVLCSSVRDQSAQRQRFILFCGCSPCIGIYSIVSQMTTRGRHSNSVINRHFIHCPTSYW